MEPESGKTARISKEAKLLTVYPSGTLPVSVTGRACALKCSHCGGRYLEKMVEWDDFVRNLEAKVPASVLLSGGCSAQGFVPVSERLVELKNRLGGSRTKVNVHPGIVPDDQARIIADLADVVSFDFLMDEDAIREAFHGTWGKEEYVRTFKALRNGKARVVPHVLVGILGGKINREIDAVKFLLDQGIDSLVFIVFIPTRGTLWEHLKPPEPHEVADLIATARTLAPRLCISLGCMRPGGLYRKMLDPAALEAGVDAIVLPHKDAVELAQRKGIQIERKEECCAFE